MSTPPSALHPKNTTYYGATQRLVSTSGNAGGTGPSLKCNGELSKINSKVGLITADEIAFAGSAYGYYNRSTYLQENTGTNWWWSLSPRSFGGSDAFVWVVYSGGLDNYGRVDYSNGVRPVISLISSTNVTGDGTSENPYVVET